MQGLVAFVLVIALFGLCVQGQTTCTTSISLKQDPSTSAITYSNSTTFTVNSATDTICIQLTLNNIVGTTWSVSFPSNNVNSSALLTYNLLEYPIASGDSVFISVDSYNRLPTGKEFTTDWVLTGPDLGTPYEMVVRLRADNADMAVVNNTLFSWADNTLPQWAGSIFFADVSPANSKKECQHFSYSYLLQFPLGTSQDILVTTTGLDTANGQVSDDMLIPAGTIDPVLIHGNFTASKGFYEFRMISEVLPLDGGVEEGAFEIKATTVSLVPTLCNKPKKELSTGALIGIIVGSAVIGLIIIVILACLIAQCLKKKKDGYESFD